MQTKKQALIVVDVQNDFCPGGTLAVDHGDEVVAPLNKLIAIFLKLDNGYRNSMFYGKATIHNSIRDN